MKTLLVHLKWQLVLLHKNKIISISLGVTFIYGAVLFFIKDFVPLDKVLISIILNDPSIIGYFFIGIAVYTEIKHKILSAIFTTPINLHHYIISKTLALSFIGLVCSLGLAFFIKGWDYDILTYTIGTFGICILSTLLGLKVLTFASDFLKFSMLSVPVFILFITIPMLHFLGAIQLGFVKYLFPIQGCLDLIENGITGIEINLWYAYLSILFWIPIFYIVAHRLFSKKVVHQNL